MIVLKCYLIACYLFITLVMGVAIHSFGKKPEKLDLKNLVEGFESIQCEFPLPDYRISVVHGKMKNDLKDFERFLHEKYCTHLPVELKELKYSVWRKAMESIKKKIM